MQIAFFRGGRETICNLSMETVERFIFVWNVWFFGWVWILFFKKKSCLATLILGIVQKNLSKFVHGSLDDFKDSSVTNVYWMTKIPELHFYKLSMCYGMFSSEFQFPRSHGFTRLSNFVIFFSLFLSFSYMK